MTLQSANAPPATPVAAHEDTFDLRRLHFALMRGKYVIALATFLAIAAGAFYIFQVATPLYRATAVVILETRQDQIVDLQSVVGGLSGDTSEINSEVEVLKARTLMGKVVDHLGLMDDPEFNRTLEPAMLPRQIKAFVSKAFQPAPNDKGTLQEPNDQRMRDTVISTLLTHVSVRNVPLSLVFKVTAESRDPEKAKRIADKVVELYILNQIDVKYKATERASAWLSERVADLRDELERAEAAASQFTASTNLVSAEGLRALERQATDVRERIQSVEEHRAGLLLDIAKLQTASGGENRTELAGISNSGKSLKGPTTARETASDFTKLADPGASGLKQDVARVEMQLATLKVSEKELADRISSQSRDLIAFKQLNREAEATRLLYEHFLTRLKETSAQQGIQQPDSRILSDAVVPGVPSSPRKSLVLTLTGLFGLTLGTGLALLAEVRHNGFRTASELEMHTGIGVLGQIPRLPPRVSKQVLKYLTDKPASAIAEAVRNLRTSLFFSNSDAPPQVIAMTSALPGEGKTVTSLALAKNLLGLGKSVLLLEADIRRRSLHEYVENMPSVGLASYLNGDIGLSDALYRPPGFEGDILCSEECGTNPADLFASDKFRTFLEQARETYDYILIDTPPVLAVPDARIIARLADAVLFVVRWDMTTKPQIDEALRLLRSSNQSVTGLILSQVNHKRMRNFGYNGRTSAYGVDVSKYYSS